MVKRSGSVLSAWLLLAAVAFAGDTLSGERVDALPQDEGKMYLTIFGDEGDAAFVRVRNWFDYHPTLRAIRDQVHYRAIAADSVLYRERFAGNTPTLPCIRLQQADGVILYQVSGSNIPDSPETLLATAEMDMRLRVCPNGRCRPDEQQQPATPPKADPPAQPLAVPPLDTKPEPRGPSPVGYAVAVALAVAGATVGGYLKYKQIG